MAPFIFDLLWNYSALLCIIAIVMLVVASVFDSKLSTFIALGFGTKSLTLLIVALIWQPGPDTLRYLIPYVLVLGWALVNFTVIHDDEVRKAHEEPVRHRAASSKLEEAGLWPPR